MRRDSHYSLQAALASRAGIDVDKAVLAWANSQTDECKGFGFHTQVNYISWANPLDKTGYYFHFIPGGGEPNPLVVGAGGKCAWLLVRDALYSGSSVRLGMALHSFMDTWSHQGFIGKVSTFNSAPYWQQGWKCLVPDYGHADYLTAPDECGASWFDSRHQRQVDNKVRFQDCYCAVATILHVNRDERADIYEVIDEPSFDKRKELWQTIAGVPPYSEVSSQMWAKHKDEFKDAAKKQVKIVREFMGW